MKRLLLAILLVVLATGGVTTITAVAPTPAKATVVLDGNSPFSAADPSVTGRVMVATSDTAPNAFPIYIATGRHLAYMHRVAYVFPAGYSFTWSLPPPLGHYWAPDVHFQKTFHRWLVYFAGSSNGRRAPYGQMMIFVAWSKTLQGPWKYKPLHWLGQFNSTSPAYWQETYGGVIDPGAAWQPDTGQGYLAWSEQPCSAWLGKLSAGGLSLLPDIRMIFWCNSQYDCEIGGSCVVEGTAPFFHMVNGAWKMYIFYSVRSTWDWSYAMRAAFSTAPYYEFQQIPGYILRAGHGWFGPGGGAAPVKAPDGRWLEFYHATRGSNPAHISNLRMLLVGVLHWLHDGLWPRVNWSGLAG